MIRIIWHSNRIPSIIVILTFGCENNWGSEISSYEIELRIRVTHLMSHSNINPKIHLNKSKLHLTRHGYEKLGRNFVNFIRNNYTWLTESNKKKTNIDISVSSASSTFNEKSEIDNEIVDHITNADLKSLRIRNLNKIVVGHLNINSIKNKFDLLAHQVNGNIDMLMTSETKLDESFPASQFF